jgi:hypothetical protein
VTLEEPAAAAAGGAPVPPRGWRRALRSLRQHRLAQAAVLYAAFVIASLPEPKASLLWGMAAHTLFSLSAPLSLIGARRFWWSALGSAALWLALFVAINATCEAWLGRVGDDAMVFLLPFMLYPAALGAAMLAHLLRRRDPSAA